MAVTPRLMTADELMRLPDDGLRHELIRGELHTMPPGGLGHGDEASVFDGSLGQYVRAHKLGRVYTADPGFVLETDPDTVRAPDVAFLRRDRVPTGEARRHYFRGVPDIAVEVISPNDLYTEVDVKVGEWLAHGCQLVFVVNPRRQTVAVHRADRSVSVLGVEDVLSGENIVPGWTLPVRELFEEE